MIVNILIPRSGAIGRGHALTLQPGSLMMTVVIPNPVRNLHPLMVILITHHFTTSIFTTTLLRVAFTTGLKPTFMRNSPV